jgi:hypothetical protein
MDDPSDAFKKREVLYKNIKHPEISEGDRCTVVEYDTKYRAEIICVRQYRVGDVDGVPGNFEFLVHFDHLPDRRYDTWIERHSIADIEKAVKEENHEATDGEGEGPAKRARRMRKKPVQPDQQSTGTSKLSLEEELKQYDDFTKVLHVTVVDRLRQSTRRYMLRVMRRTSCQALDLDFLLEKIPYICHANCEVKQLMQEVTLKLQFE